MAAVARTFAVSREAVRQTATRWHWVERSAAYDSAYPTAADLPAVLESVTPIRPGEGKGLPEEYLLVLEQFRSEVEATGRGHVRLARGLSAAASKNVARVLNSDQPLTPRDIAALASTSAALANSGVGLWSKALGVERLLQQMEMAEADGVVEVIN
jgi:hypothetical protein